MTQDMDSFDLQLLDPAEVRLLRVAGILRLTLPDRSCIRVQVMRAFPISDPDRYYALLDGDGHDVGVVVEPSRLDDQSRELAEQAVESRYFVPIVERVYEAREDFGSVIWDVQTDRGRRRFVVRAMRDNMVEVGPGRVQITDVDGNRFTIPDVQKMEPTAQLLVMKNL